MGRLEYFLKIDKRTCSFIREVRVSSRGPLGKSTELEIFYQDFLAKALLLVNPTELEIF